MKSPRELFQKGKTLFFYADSCKLSAAESFQKKKKLRQTMIKVWQSHTCIHKTLSATEVMNQD